jgi:hypothetical protein
MTMRKDPNFILDTLIYNRYKPQAMKLGRYTYTRKILLREFVDEMWNINTQGQKVLERFESFKAFLKGTGGIHGKTHEGRKFFLYYFEEEQPGMYNRTKTIVTQMKVKIYEPDGAVFAPYTSFSDAMNNSILSAVNKYEKKFFWKGKNLRRIESTDIDVKGIYNDKPFDIHLNVGTNGMMGKFNYCGDTKNLGFKVPIPGHIPEEQHHRFTVRSLCSHEILKAYIFDMIKQNYMMCCDEKVKAGDRFCKKCGKEFEMQDLEVTDVKDETKETILI